LIKIEKINFGQKIKILAHSGKFIFCPISHCEQKLFKNCGKNSIKTVDLL
jgi:hypothetical protein